MLGKLLARGAAATQRQVALAARRPGVAAVRLGEACGTAAATPASTATTATGGLRRQLGTEVGTGDEGRSYATSDLPQDVDEQQQQSQWQHSAASPPAGLQEHEEINEDGESGRRKSWRGDSAAWKSDSNRPRGEWDDRSRGKGLARMTGRDSYRHRRRGERGTPGREGRIYSKASIQYFESVQEMRRAGNWNGVIKAYQQACDDEDVDFTSSMFNITIAALSRSPKWQVSLSILQEMREAEAVPLDTYTFNAALMACVHGRQGKLAFALLQEMLEVGVSPDSFTYSHLVSVCGHEGKWEKALSLIEEMMEAGIRPNCVAYNGAIVACGNAGEADRAVALLDRMRGDGVHVTEGSYSAAIAACGKNGKWERALELMEEMKEGRDNLEPNEYCYNSAISACERAARWEEALTLLREMQQEQLMVTVGTYTHVVKACTNAGEISEARALLSEMRSNGMHVKRATVMMVEKRAERRGGGGRFGGTSPTAVPYLETVASEAERLLSPAWQGDGVDFPRRPSAAAAAADDANAPSKAAAAAAVGPPSPKSARVRNVKQFLLAMGSHSRNRRWAEIVADLDAAMADPRTKVSMRMYEGCLYGLASGGKWEEALAVLEKMQEVGLKPNSSCVTGAIKACGKADPPKWGLALSLLGGLEEPEVWAYVAALTALAKGGQWKASEALMAQMKTSGVEPNLYCYSAFLEACRRAEPPQWQHACSVLAQMKQDETVPPNDVCYKTVIHACQAASETSVAEELLSEMAEAGFALQAEDLRKKPSPSIAAVAECASP
ncbi:unnamed protein product [Hapterophycus canaliculatus]